MSIGGLWISQIAPVVYEGTVVGGSVLAHHTGGRLFMRFEIFSNSLKAAALASLALSLGAGSALAQAGSSSANDLPADREEIIITHQRLGPLSEWAAMQQHSDDYRRLKAKYDPTQGSSHTDNWASDRNLAAHNQANDSFIQESADQPTPPAVKAAEDAIVPP
jgi:hypothetical protein